MLIYIVYIPDYECSEKVFYTTNLLHAEEIQKLYFSSRIDIQYVWEIMPPVNEKWWQIGIHIRRTEESQELFWEVYKGEPADLNRVRQYGPGERADYWNFMNIGLKDSMHSVFVPGNTLEEACKIALEIAKSVWPITQDVVDYVPLEIKKEDPEGL